MHELTIVEHVIAVAAWGFPLDIMDLCILGKLILDIEGRIVSEFNDNIPEKVGPLFFKTSQTSHSKNELKY